MLWLLFLAVLAAALFVTLGRKSAAPPAPASSTSSPSAGAGTVPERLPVQAKRYFFARSERAFYEQLLRAVPDGYVIFPNVRLNDLFRIQASGSERQATYARLRDKHVDFVLVRLPDYEPALAIELDGASHDAARQQYRDAVKDAVFASGGLRLLRIRTDALPSEAELSALLRSHLGASGAAATAPARPAEPSRAVRG